MVRSSIRQTSDQRGLKRRRYNSFYSIETSVSRWQVPYFKTNFKSRASECIITYIKKFLLFFYAPFWNNYKNFPCCSFVLKLVVCWKSFNSRWLPVFFFFQTYVFLPRATSWCNSRLVVKSRKSKFSPAEYLFMMKKLPKWFESYLTGRQQLTLLNNVESDQLHEVQVQVQVIYFQLWT